MDLHLHSQNAEENKGIANTWFSQYLPYIIILYSIALIRIINYNHSSKDSSIFF